MFSIKKLFFVFLQVSLLIWPFAHARVISPRPEKTVELAIFIDQHLYHHWGSLLTKSSRSSSSVQEFIHSYLDVLLQSLNLIYAHPSLLRSSSEGVPGIGFHLAHTQLVWLGNGKSVESFPRDSITIPATYAKSDHKAKEAAPAYLERFCDLANKRNWGGTRWDHALLLTGVDLNFPNGTNYGVAGISWDNSMCNRTYSCSVVEGKTFRSIMTTVHEIGHSLGIEHDGLKYNFKCPPRGYIMSFSGGGDDIEDADKNSAAASPMGKIAWSPCSSNNLRAFLSTAPNVLSNQVSCLNNNPTVTRTMRGFFSRGRSGKAVDADGGNEFLPGQVFNTEEQCRLQGGSIWKPSEKKRHTRKMCSSLYCKNIITNVTVQLHPALEGTSCGGNKYCRFGTCVPSASASETTTVSEKPARNFKYQQQQFQRQRGFSQESVQGRSILSFSFPQLYSYLQ